MNSNPIKDIPPVKKVGPLFTNTKYKDTKDPCPVFDGTKWHIYGSGGSVRNEKWHILHATAPHIDGPWTEEDTVILEGMSGERIAAPGVAYDFKRNEYDMFLQTDFMIETSSIEYLTSKDGQHFTKKGTLLYPEADSLEAGLYDPHPAEIDGKKYLVYAATPRTAVIGIPFASKPDIFLAESESDSWEGPWKRRGKLVDHNDIEWHHNRRDHKEYEWGIEGGQIIKLPQGHFLLNATCFLPEGRFGTRQRIFFAISNTIEGPYLSIGPVLPSSDNEWENGENGHAAAIIENDSLYLFYQARSRKNEIDIWANDWRYGTAIFNAQELEEKMVAHAKVEPLPPTSFPLQEKQDDLGNVKIDNPPPQVL